MGLKNPLGTLQPSNQWLSATTIPWSATQPSLVLSTQHCVTSLKTRSVFNGCVPLGLSRSGSLIRDHSDYGISNDLMNPCSEWIHRFIWSTMIRVISDHWSWSGSPIRKAPIYPGDRHVLNPNMLFLNVCLSFVIKIHVRQKWGIHYWNFQNFQSFVWRNVWVPGWHQLGNLAWARFVCLFFSSVSAPFLPFPHCGHLFQAISNCAQHHCLHNILAAT